MRRIKTEQIRGREILAKDIYSAGGVVLISEGTILKKEYIEKLKLEKSKLLQTVILLLQV